jgi:hypothetical protein
MLVLAYLGAVAGMILCATIGRGKEWVQMFISVVSAMWDQRHVSFILLSGFLCDIFEL